MGLIINFIIVLASLGGIVFILWRKISLLKELPEQPVGGTEGVRELVTGRAKNIVSSQKARLIASGNLNRTLLKAKTLASKTEKQTGEWLDRLQKRQKERKEEFSESYWDQLRKRGKKK